MALALNNLKRVDMPLNKETNQTSFSGVFVLLYVLFKVTTALPLFASFITISLFSCMFLRRAFLSVRDCYASFFSFKLMFHSFSKNVFNSLLLSLSGKNFDLYFSRELSMFSLLWNFSINLNFLSNSVRSLFNSHWLLFRVGKILILILVLKNQSDFYVIFILIDYFRFYVVGFVRYVTWIGLFVWLVLPKTTRNDLLAAQAKQKGNVSEFELQSRCYTHFWTNALGKGMNPLFLNNSRTI